jgi:hypothetical protein
MDPKSSVEHDEEAILDRGDAAEGDSYQTESHHPEGVSTVRRKDGGRVFFSRRYMDMMRKRNRARGG